MMDDGGRSLHPSSPLSLIRLSSTEKTANNQSRIKRKREREKEKRKQAAKLAQDVLQTF